MALDPATPGAQFDLGSRPDIKSKDDLPGLERWFRNISGRLRRVTAGIYFENIPKRAIAEGLDPNVPVAKGDRATELADLGANIRALGYHWNSISDNLERFAGNINATYLEIQAIEADADFTRLQVKESSSPWIEAGFAVASVVLAANTGGVGSIALGYISAGTADYLVLGSAISKGALSVSSSVEEANKSSDLESLVNESEEAKLGLALNGLNDEAILKLGAVRDSFKGLQDAIPVINAKVGIVEQSERKAKYFLAKTAGQEGVVIDDQQVELVLNTIAGAEASSTRVRYETLVKEARVLAYLARLAIEQRIGTRLQDMDTTISNLDAPSTWVDDICILSGHDANEPFTLDLEEDDVKNTYLPDGGIEAFVEELHELFDVEGSSGEEAEREDLRYIGDYVQRLRNFMTLYNVQFPSRDSEDIAVLSMRDDILVSDLDDCLQSSPNLLYFSGNLAGGLNDVTEDGVPVVLGWQPGGCAAEGCVVASTLENIPLPAGIGGGASWLRDFSASAEEPTLPAPDAGAPNQGDVGVPRAIYQTLTLVPGSYVLSWWDQARGPTGLAHAVNDPLVDYRVAIVNPDLSTAQSVTLMPEASDWSGRRELRFKVEQTGLFSVAFYASAFLDQQGSLAIANVQLESVARPVDPPSAYVATTQSRLAFGGRCQSAEDFRNQWAYQCEGSRCFFELRHPFRIDTNDLASGLSPLEGQLAVGNFNYRHITNAINLVGTEVVDCEGTPSVSCFANAQLEYDLVHEAFDTILLDENGEGRHFDFGQGEINHGKALAAERLITSPLGSSDADLLSQPQFTKAEFGGRPLSGNYHLRIYDTPALRWDNVEDVQLIWNYRYWSRVQRSSGN